MKKESIYSFAAVILVVLIAAGLAFAGSQGGYAISGFPIYALCFLVAFIIQWLAFIPAYLYRTEKFYDLTGSITFITVLLIGLILTPRIDPRSILLFVVIIIWAIRLGSFLFTRIRSAGEDRRFREIKGSFPRFLLAWTLQGFWVTFSLAVALAAMTSKVRIGLDIFAAVGFILWLAGFAIEVIADRQKSQFNAKLENKDMFISSGLWSWSRHPNYFGEIVLWIGVAVIALPVLRGWQWVTMISPVFIIVLLTRISGIPMLEERADQKWGGQIDYETYKLPTSVFNSQTTSQQKIRGSNNYYSQLPLPLLDRISKISLSSSLFSNTAATHLRSCRAGLPTHRLLLHPHPVPFSPLLPSSNR